MLWLYIILGILLFFALLLLLPIKIYASYFESFKCILYVGFVKIQLYPRKPKKRKKKPEKSKEKEEKRKEDKPDALKKNGLSWLVNLIKRTADLAAGVLKDFFARILIKKLQLSIRLAGSDAADTAIKYGKYCAVVYPAVSIITSTVKCPEYGVDIVPDFKDNAKTVIEFELAARVFVFNLVGLVLRHGMKALKMLADLKN